jgi:hypothetical protein
MWLFPSCTGWPIRIQLSKRPKPRTFSSMTGYFWQFLHTYRSVYSKSVTFSRDSSVVTATDWTAGLQFPARLSDIFPLHTVQTASWVHLTSYSTSTRGDFPQGRAAGAWSWPLTI